MVSLDLPSMFSPPSQQSPGPHDATVLVNPTPETLLIIYIHGFKGTDDTFGEFPARLGHVLTGTIDNVTVDCIVFPAYETKGKLDDAVVRFADWLTTITVQREVASGGGAGSLKIVLCGHSMGGLLAADTLREFAKTRVNKTCPLWPRIIACIAFDTPYLGLHPSVVKNSVTRAAEYATVAKTVGATIFGSLAGFGVKKSVSNSNQAPAPPTSEAGAQTGWSRWASPAAYAVGGAVLAGAAAGGAYYKRQDLGQGYAWATDHMKYIGTLWDEAALQKRIEDLISIEEGEGVTFRTFYTLLPPAPPAHLTPRTFIVIPQRTSPAYPYFYPIQNSVALDEIHAHTGMFGGRTNDGYYGLGLETAKLIREAIMLGRGVFEHEDWSGKRVLKEKDSIKNPTEPSDATFPSNKPTTHS